MMKKHLIILIYSVFSVSCLKEETKCSGNDCVAGECKSMKGIPGDSQPKNYTGKSYTCYSSGTVQSIANYVNGKREGELLTYYENGQLWQRLNFNNDRLDGLNIDYYENGIVKRKSHYAMGDKDGDMKEYDEKGNYQRTLIYKVIENDDELVGCEGDCEGIVIGGH